MLDFGVLLSLISLCPEFQPLFSKNSANIWKVKKKILNLQMIIKDVAV